MKVLVAGGGIAGLVAARALALRGFKVTLMERKARIADEGGIGIGLQSNAMTALAAIGVAKHCVAAGIPVATMHTYAPDGRLLFSRPAERFAGTAWPGFTGIRRATLHAILVAAAADAGATLLTSARVTEVTDTADAVEVRLADGRVLTSDLLVGADGIRSGLRAQLFPDHAQPVATGEAVWRGLLPGVARDDVSFIFGGRVGTVGYTPLKGDLYLYIVDRAAHAPPPDATNLADRMIALLASYGAFVPDLIPRISHAPGDVTWWPLETILLPDRWYRGRALLIGDAAHAGPPTLAQGAAMGIEDGVVLADVLATSDSVAAALDRFMARRLARVTTVVEASLVIARAQMEPNGQALVVAAQRRAGAALAEPY